MRKPRDYDAELKALGDKARALKARKVEQCPPSALMAQI
jgi:hypothetical protein